MWQTLLNFFFYSIAAIAAENVLFARALGLSYLGGQPRRIADTLLFGGVFTGMTVLSSGITWAVSNMLGSRPYLNYLRPTAFFAVICLIYLACYFVFRHWPKAVNDDGLYPRAALTAAACLALYHLALLAWKDAPSCSDGDEALLWARFSREVEHDEANFFALAEALSDPAEWPLARILRQ